MSFIVQSFVEMIFSLLPLFLLFILFLIGYYFAWHDFKPKQVERDERYPFSHPMQFEPVVKRRELSRRELGIEEIGHSSALPAIEQRRFKMGQIIRDYSSTQPEETANVIKVWLREG
ncbi:MAG: hypothetical protein C4527_05085 [Candidatus Omnitrophota bacterium]|jgi:flagellar biosynthesis/type III secretory pathway M-ring protein FliF/YscJ|nr:MAG: hypothetical protein C4527_05085 [Candidatus Omnitrophota bacterium]